MRRVQGERPECVSSPYTGCKNVLQPGPEEPDRAVARWLALSAAQAPGPRRRLPYGSQLTPQEFEKLKFAPPALLALQELPGSRNQKV